MKRYAFATAVLLLVVFPWRQTPQADTPAYTVEALGTSASINNLIPAETGINASGQVSGTVTDTHGNTRAVRYTDGIGWEFVPGLTWGSSAAAINVNGDIVGTRLVGGLSHAYRYNYSSGAIDDIKPLGNGTTSFGFGINDTGDVVGQSDLGAGLFGAFIARVGQSPVQLPSLGGGNDTACGINATGQIAETTTDQDGLQFGARVDTDGTLHSAGTVDGTLGMSSACAIDDLGHIAGRSSSNLFRAFHAFRWDPANSVIADAGLPAVDGNVESISAGVSVGWYMLSNGSFRALMHSDANGAVDVNTLLPVNSGWVLTEVKGINASGQMVGDGFLNGVSTVFRMGPAKATDTTAPIIASHADVTSEATGPNGASVSYSAPTTTDNVDPNGTATCAPASGSMFALGATTVTCSATDAAGNAATPTTFSVIVKDTTPPVIAAHADVSAEATGPSGANVSYTAPSTTDAVDGTGAAVCAPASGSAFTLGATTVACSAKDAAGNPATPTTFSVVVKDTTAPVIAAHADVSAEATGPSGAAVTYVVPNTTDAVDGTRTATCLPASGSMFTLGTTPVNCTAADAAGNVAAPTSFNVVVKDTTAPVIAAHADVSAEATGPNGAAVIYGAVTTTDAVDGTRTASCAPASGSTFVLGTTVVTCSAVDAAGNVATPMMFKVRVVDTTAPVITMVYASPDAIWPPNGKFVPVSVMVTASDAVDPSPSCTLTSITGGTAGGAAISGPLSANVRADSGAVYTLTVTCADFSGNKASASTTVVVAKTNGNGGTPRANGKSLTTFDDDDHGRSGRDRDDNHGRKPGGDR